MPFILIEGTFHLVGQTPRGNPTGFEPDGDSMQFLPRTPALLDRLEQLRLPYRLSSIGSVPLRFEGIDALELHYGPDTGGPETFQPRPLADQARDALTGLLGMNPVPYTPPRNIRVDPPVPADAVPGFILSRSLEVHGRPVAFAFHTPPPAPDGSDVFLTPALLRRSLNYALLRQGHAYPLFYETLFADLRNVLVRAARRARAQGLGLWPQDASQTGVTATRIADLEASGVTFPKLFRRLADYFALGNANLTGFLAWAATKQEQVQELPTTNFTHFDNVITVQGNTVSLTRQPEELVFISAK